MAADFQLLHDNARHIFHLKETLESAEHTVQGLVLELKRWITSRPEFVNKNRPAWIQAKQDLLFIEKQIFSYKIRSRVLWERQENVINYVRDNKYASQNPRSIRANQTLNRHSILQGESHSRTVRQWELLLFSAWCIFLEHLSRYVGPYGKSPHGWQA